MRRALIAVCGLIGLLLLAGIAWAALRTVSMVNFDFIDDATSSTSQVTINQGDQIKFTLKSQGSAATPHSVEIDELGIHSGDLTVNDTYTTPPISQVGTFRLYCKRHQRAGHQTTLVVQATQTTSGPPPTPTPKPAQPVSSSAPPPVASTGTSPASSPTDQASASSVHVTPTEPVPTGLGTAEGAALDVSPGPDSLAGILGRRPTPRGPWTRSLTLGLLAGLPLVAIALYAWQLERGRVRGG